MQPLPTAGEWHELRTVGTAVTDRHIRAVRANLGAGPPVPVPLNRTMIGQRSLP